MFSNCLEENQLVDVLNAARGNVRVPLVILPVSFLTPFDSFRRSDSILLSARPSLSLAQ